MSKSLRIILVDDHQMFRDGIRRRLEQESDLEVVAEAANGEDALELVKKIKPDVVFLDIRLPTISGIETAARMRSMDQKVKIIMLSGYDYEQYVRTVFKIPVEGYLLKDAPQDDVVNAVREVVKGGTVAPPRIAAKLVRAFRKEPAPPPQPDQLSPREVEIMEMVAGGLKSIEIALRLGVSARTVETHLISIFSKLGADTRVDAVRIALDRNLIH